jgi:hypothetical protein
MTKLLFLLLCVLITLSGARENPFFAPSQEEKTPAPPPSEIRTDAVPVIEVHTKNQEPPAERNARKKEILNFEYVRFVLSEGLVQVETKDRLIKHFALPKKNVIVMDFEQKADFATKRKMLAVGPFKELRLGVHKGFYRVAFELEKFHTYRISKGRYGYVLVLEKNDETR